MVVVVGFEVDGGLHGGAAPVGFDPVPDRHVMPGPMSRLHRVHHQPGFVVHLVGGAVASAPGVVGDQHRHPLAHALADTGRHSPPDGAVVEGGAFPAGSFGLGQAGGPVAPQHPDQVGLFGVTASQPAAILPGVLLVEHYRPRAPFERDFIAPGRQQGHI